MPNSPYATSAGDVVAQRRTSNPASTLAWLRAPKPAVTKRFATDVGPVQYNRLLRTGTTHKRLSYLVDAACEISLCDSQGGTLVFDHCHRHGWVRAVLCNGHNVRIAHLEAAWLQYGVDLSGTPYWPVLMSCGDCRDLAGAAAGGEHSD